MAQIKDDRRSKSATDLHSSVVTCLPGSPSLVVFCPAELCLSGFFAEEWFATPRDSLFVVSI